MPTKISKKDLTVAKRHRGKSERLMCKIKEVPSFAEGEKSK